MEKIGLGLKMIDDYLFKGKMKACYSRHLKYYKKAYRLTSKLYFPPHTAANKKVRQGPASELLAIGGDLSPERMILAYKSGIDLSFYQDEPILWWTSKVRCILLIDDLHIGKDVKRFLKNDNFRLTIDQAYAEVVQACSEGRKGPTWLTPERKAAAVKLHELGLAHSVEVWQDEQLVAGLYLTQIGAHVYIESMFTRVKNGSKAAFTALALRLKEENIAMIDLGTWMTENLEQYGAITISRDAYLKELNKNLDAANSVEEWASLFENWDFKAAVENYLERKAELEETAI